MPVAQMSLAIANALGTVKEIVGDTDVSTVGASIFVQDYCSDDEIAQIRAQIDPQRVELLSPEESPVVTPKTRIDL